MTTEIDLTNDRTSSTGTYKRKRKQVKILFYVVISIFILAITGVAVVFIIEHRKAFLTNTPYEEKDDDSIKMIHLNLTANNSLEYLTEAVDNITFPGTKWCGRGCIAITIDDLGTFQDTDKCCRAHDGCFDWIGSGETKYGLKDTGIFVRSHCDCDHAFYQCLKNTSNTVSDMVGFGYFTLFGPKCFKEEYPFVGCRKHELSYLTLKAEDQMRCVDYELNTNAAKVYQWFDNALYL